MTSLKTHLSKRSEKQNHIISYLCKVLCEPQNRTKHVDQSADAKQTLQHIQNAVDADYLIHAGLNTKIRQMCAV